MLPNISTGSTCVFASPMCHWHTDLLVRKHLFHEMNHGIHLPFVGKEATHVGFSNPNFSSIQRFGVMAGGREMPPSLGRPLTFFARRGVNLCKTSVHYPVFFSPPCPNGPELWRALIDRWPLDLWKGTQRNAIPVRVKAHVREGHGKLIQPNINVPSTTVQRFSHENSMSHNWPRETMTNGKFPAQKIQVDHPSVSLGDQFAYEVLHKNSSATFGRDAIHS